MRYAHGCASVTPGNEFVGILRISEPLIIRKQYIETTLWRFQPWWPLSYISFHVNCLCGATLRDHTLVSEVSSFRLTEARGSGSLLQTKSSTLSAKESKCVSVLVRLCKNERDTRPPMLSPDRHKLLQVPLLSLFMLWHPRLPPCTAYSSRIARAYQIEQCSCVTVRFRSSDFSPKKCMQLGIIVIFVAWIVSMDN